MANILQYVDSYKPTMHDQYPEGVVEVHSYGESRTGGVFPESVIFGMSRYLKKYLAEPITRHDVDEMETVMRGHFSGWQNAFNRSVFDHVINKHGGFFPVEICAVPEGVLLPEGIPSFTVRNLGEGDLTKSLTTYLETSILPSIWYPSTVATISHRIRQVIKDAMEKSCDNLDGLDFKLHDFGTRGASCFEASAIGGMAHLLSFMGTDNVPALFEARKYYQSNIAGVTIPAMEHSTVTSWLRLNETAAYRNMIKNHAGAGMVAIVADSYDTFNATANIFGGSLKSEIIGSLSTVVIRSDSGDPLETLPRLLHIMADKFGYVVNSKGFKVVNNVRLIQSDGVNEDLIWDVLTRILDQGFSADNVSFGMGGALLQHCDRDWGRWAMKCSQVTFADGTTREVVKDPATDPTKRSKGGKFSVYWHTQQNKYVCKPLTEHTAQFNMLQPVYRNGEILRLNTLDEVRRQLRRV